MKKKILSLCLIAVLVVTAIGGATLAYFTDTDKADNVFTTGNVDIELIEDFGDNDGDTPEKLLPIVGNELEKDDYGYITTENVVTKMVYVANRGSEESYVRVHIAVPTVLDNNNHFHIVWTEDENWTVPTAASYTTTIDKIGYNVYVCTYALEMKAPWYEEGASFQSYDYTTAVMEAVYLDYTTTNGDVKDMTDALGNSWSILVVAEGAQSAGFDDAVTALNTAFGEPGKYAVDFSGATKA